MPSSVVSGATERAKGYCLPSSAAHESPAAVAAAVGPATLTASARRLRIADVRTLAAGARVLSRQVFLDNWGRHFFRPIRRQVFNDLDRRTHAAGTLLLVTDAVRAFARRAGAIGICTT